MNKQEPTVSKIKRGQGAEWCRKCRLFVMPVGLGAGGVSEAAIRWGCPNCYTLTEERPAER